MKERGTVKEGADMYMYNVCLFADDPGLEAMYREAWYPDHELDFVSVSCLRVHTWMCVLSEVPVQFWETAVPEWVYAVIINAPIRKSKSLSILIKMPLTSQQFFCACFPLQVSTSVFSSTLTPSCCVEKTCPRRRRGWRD